MRRFHFPLNRVMEWRRTEARLEESKLEQLSAELRAIDTRIVGLNEERFTAEKEWIAMPASTAVELAAVSAFQRFAVAEQRRLAAKRTDCAQRIAAQTLVVAEKRRALRLLEKLKERRLETWRTEMTRESDAEAEESYLARWNRDSRSVRANDNHVDLAARRGEIEA